MVVIIGTWELLSVSQIAMKKPQVIVEAILQLQLLQLQLFYNCSLMRAAPTLIREYFTLPLILIFFFLPDLVIYKKTPSELHMSFVGIYTVAMFHDIFFNNLKLHMHKC